jgi:hypothetical protein
MKQGGSRSDRARFRSTFVRAVALATVAVSVVVLVEGLASVAIAFYEVALRHEPAYSRYDPLLGWVSKPNVHIPAKYGPGKYVRTNSLGFRNDEEVAPEVAPGKVRVLCSGNSFTFGEGVSNDRTWCHLLALRDRRIETFNLGQPGYGVDQAYLRYFSSGAPLEHSVHLFAFIGADIERMGRASHHHYAKPVLRLERGKLTTGNVPVPRIIPGVGRYMTRAAERLRFVDLSRRVLARIGPEPGLVDTARPVADTLELARHVFEDLQERSDQAGVLLVFVYLPVLSEIVEPAAEYAGLVELMERSAYAFVDLGKELRRVPPDHAHGFFIPECLEGELHYSESGNEWVARTLWDRLQELAAWRALPLHPGAET